MMISVTSPEGERTNVASVPSDATNVVSDTGEKPCLPEPNGLTHSKTKASAPGVTLTVLPGWTSYEPAYATKIFDSTFAFVDDRASLPYG